MPQLLTESIVDKLVTYFKANFAAKVAALNTAYDDEFELETPDTTVGYFVGAKAIEDGATYPCVFVWGDSMVIDRYGEGYTDASHEVEIVVAVRHGEPEQVQRQMYRYARAVWELIVSRFFGLSDRSDFFTTGSPRVEYERPPALESSGLYIGRMHMFVTFNKQEAVS